MTQTIDISIAGLHQLYTRIGQQRLDHGDWPLVGALVAKLLVREEARMRRMEAKVAAEAAPESGAVIDVEHEEVDAEPGDVAATDGGRPNQALVTTPNGTTAKPSKKIKNHGRNGVTAYTNAKHIVHALMGGVLGVLCECGKACMTKYREKVTVRAGLVGPFLKRV